MEYKVEVVSMRGGNWVEFTNDYRIDRGTPVGNPYPEGLAGGRDEVCDKYEAWFSMKVEQQDSTIMAYLSDMLGELERWGSVRLFCWCAPKRCHGETIRRFLLQQVAERQANRNTDAEFNIP